MWSEAARIIGAYQRHLVNYIGDLTNHPLVAYMLDQPPVAQALIDARAATSRPADTQVKQVRALAEQLRYEHEAAGPPRFDVELAPGSRFAVFPRRVPGAESLPGYCEVDGKAQVWLCPRLQDFIISDGLEPSPDLLPAIAEETERITGHSPWALVLERASVCSDPGDYPSELVPLLQAMRPKGLARQ
jgi:hypothetical protein